MFKWFERMVKRAVEDTIMRLYKNGSISVTVRYAIEGTKCAACNGTGRAESGPFNVTRKGAWSDDLMFLSQGICLACRGKGRA